MFAGPGEEGVAEQTIDGALADPTRVTNLAGKLDLPRLAAYLGRLDAYLSNDSGPMHLAWTQDVPLVALFGPTVKKLGFFPRGANSTVMEAADVPCRPCGLHGPKKFFVFFWFVVGRTAKRAASCEAALFIVG